MKLLISLNVDLAESGLKEDDIVGNAIDFVHDLLMNGAYEQV